jgi:hypothetical protein
MYLFTFIKENLSRIYILFKQLRKTQQLTYLYTWIIFIIIIE